MVMAGEETKKIYLHSREVEIIRYIQPSIDEEELLDTILKKDKADYPADYIVVCFVESAGELLLKELSDKLMTQLKHVEHAFLVFHGIAESDLREHALSEEMLSKVSIVKLAPRYDHQTFDLLSAWKKGKEDDKKLVYAENQVVSYGLRSADRTYPKILE